jgi:hypothetical protein
VSAVFDVEKVLSEVTPDRRYHEFLRIAAMSSGVYVLPPAPPTSNLRTKKTKSIMSFAAEAKFVSAVRELR